MVLHYQVSRHVHNCQTSSNLTTRMTT